MNSNELDSLSTEFIEDGDGELENSDTFNERVFDDDVNESENRFIDGFMSGDIEVRRLNKDTGYYESVCYLTSDMKYRMESRRGVRCYPGKDGRSIQLTIPQCKIVNSTVLDNRAMNKIILIDGDRDYIRDYPFSLDLKKYDIKSDLRNMLPFYSGENSVQNYYVNRGKFNGNHISFEIWSVIGAVYGKVIRNWKRNHKDYNKIPSWMYVRYSELFEALNPQYSWSSINQSTRTEWTLFFNSVFDFINSNELIHDLPQSKEEGYARKAVRCGNIMKTTRVYRRAEGESEERNCLESYGEKWRPVGVKARIKGSWLCGFIWKEKKNPSVVYLNKYDLMSRDIFGSRGGIGHCFHVIWAAWLVQYRNYWHKRGMDFQYCGKDGMLEFSKTEMDYGLSGGFYKSSRIDTDGMEKIIERMSMKWHIDHKNSGKWHMEAYSRIANGRIRWVHDNTSMSSEDSIIRDQTGETHSFEELVGKEVFMNLIPEEVLNTIQDQKSINEENRNHIATLFGRRVNLHESVVFHANKIGDQYSYMENKFGRSYTSGFNGMQLLKKKLRAKLKIDGKAVSEVDFSALHPHMLYAMVGKKYAKEDLYDIGDWYSKYNLEENVARNAVKKMTVIVINAMNTTSALHSFKRQWNEKNGLRKDKYIPWLYDLYDRINAAHSAINRFFCSGIGVKLQYMDGILIRKSLRRITDNGICAAGIHDSIVVQKKYANIASKFMKEEYEKMFPGSTIPVKIK